MLQIEDRIRRRREAREAIKRQEVFSKTGVDDAAVRERNAIAAEKRKIREQKVQEAKEAERHKLINLLDKAKEYNNPGLAISLERRLKELEEAPPVDVALPTLDDNSRGDLKKPHGKRPRSVSDEDSAAEKTNMTKRKRISTGSPSTMETSSDNTEVEKSRRKKKKNSKKKKASRQKKKKQRKKRSDSS